MQDLLALGAEARMNTPGQETGNWTWRIAEPLPSADGRQLARLTEASQPKVTWDPSRYHHFGDLRLRPGLDLISRLTGSPRLIYDLGCGTGELTNLLGQRFPEARVIGMDSSHEMLDRAEAAANVEFQFGSIEDFAPNSPPDLIYSNATLHWLPDHDRLFAGCSTWWPRAASWRCRCPTTGRPPPTRLSPTFWTDLGLTVNLPDLSGGQRRRNTLSWLEPADIGRPLADHLLSNPLRRMTRSSPGSKGQSSVRCGLN